MTHSLIEALKNPKTARKKPLRHAKLHHSEQQEGGRVEQLNLAWNKCQMGRGWRRLGDRLRPFALQTLFETPRLTRREPGPEAEGGGSAFSVWLKLENIK